jgi:molybdopterin molybdotransferase
MILFEDAFDILMNQDFSFETEQINLEASTGRILAENVYSDMDMPPFNKSAMDGFACRKEDLNQEMEVIETIAAGEIPQKSIGESQCSKIMTGAMVPKGADCVVMVENTEETGSNRIRLSKIDPRINIAIKGEDVKTGDLLIEKGSLIEAQHIAVMASVGHSKPTVAKKPQIGVISTGNELVEPEVKPGMSQIRNSNAYQLIAQIIKSGGIPDYYGIALDTEEDLVKHIKKASDENDIFLLTGGVSMGDFDIVPKVVRSLGYEFLFESIAVQPGKPTTFAVNDKKFCFGLPGNPVSSFMQFEMLVKPFIYKMSGGTYAPLITKLPMGKEYKRKRSTRRSIIPIRIEDDKVFPIEYHGSAHISSLINANGIVTIPIGETTLEKGKMVDVRQI